MESPLSFFSPSSYGGGSYLSDEGAYSPFSLREDEPATYSFASLAGLAEQLCGPTSTSSNSSNSSNSTPLISDSSSYASQLSPKSSPESSTFDDLVNDFFSSDEDESFGHPAYAVYDLPSSPDRSDSYYPNTPDMLATASFTSGSVNDAAFVATTKPFDGASSSTAAWEEPLMPLEDEFLAFNGLSPEQCWPEKQLSFASDAAWDELPVQQTLNTKASFESAASWATNDDDDSWDTEPFFNSVPSWSSILEVIPPTTSVGLFQTGPSSPVSDTSEVAAPSSQAMAPAPAPIPAQRASHRNSVPRTPHRVRSTPQLSLSGPPPIKQRQRLPAKASLPALREEASAITVGRAVSLADGSSTSSSTSGSMFAVLGGYGGKEQSLSSEWESRTVGSDTYGGGGGSLGFYNTLGRFEQAHGANIGDGPLGSPFHGHQEQFGSITYDTIAPSSLQQQPSYAAADPSSIAEALITPPVRTTTRAAPAPKRRSASASNAGSKPPTTRTSTKSRVASATAAPPVHSAVPLSHARARAIAQMREAEKERLREEARRAASERKLAATAVGNPLASASSSKTPPASTDILLQGWSPTATPVSSVKLRALPTIPCCPSASSKYSPAPLSPPPTIRKVSSVSRLASFPKSTTTTTTTNEASSPSPIKVSPSSTDASDRSQFDQGGFRWGTTKFINYSSADADYLLTGVAPSGQTRRTTSSSSNGGSSKRKRSLDDDDDDIAVAVPSNGKRSRA